MLPLGDNQHRQRITHHVQRGTRHIEDTVDAGNKGKPFQRDPDATRVASSTTKETPGTPAIPFEVTIRVSTG